MNALAFRRNWAGLVAIFSLVIFWLALFSPKPVHTFLDAMLRPYGLIIWFGVIGISVVFAIIAAWRSSKWWLVIALLGVLSFLYFFRGVMS